MKFFYSFLCAALLSAGAFAQPSVEWKIEVRPLENTLYEAIIEAHIPDGWHIYDTGPYEIPAMATAFDFEESQGVELVGEMGQMDVPVQKFDSILGFEVRYFEGVARFAQQFCGDDGAVFAGEVEYQLCSDTECIRATWDFNEKANSSGLWALLLQAILLGFAALLTPCVFPMVPMTVSMFLKDGGKFKALAFGGFIVGLYTLPIAVVILVTYFAGGEAVTADIFNRLATHWGPNVLFFVVFMLFAASLLGAFELRLPSKWINRSDRGVEKGGLAGVFFLALTLVLVSFSCTGPIVGTVLIKSTQGEFWVPIVTMLVFSLAFALPFVLLALFPKLLEKLPESGGWLSSVKAVLGLVEIALGLKFLSVADQVYHWGILPREIYLAIWIVVFAILGFYLLGKIRFKYDSPVEHIGVGRLAGAIVVFSFVMYLLPGMWGAPLKEISGYLPPLASSEAKIEKQSSDVKYADDLHLPHGLTGFFDLEQGLAHAREVGKPIFLDFTGHGCVNCREMEQRVWSDPAVLRLLDEKYVIVALYSDDRTRLPESDRLTTPAGKTLKTLGRKNSYIVNSRYGISSQPAYLILDSVGEPISEPYGYSLDVEKFVKFLQQNQ